MSELKIVKVAVENTALSFDGFFDYLVPEHLCDLAKVGSRVLVPFGRANIKKVAMIFSFSDNAEVSRLKSVTAVLDPEPVLSREQLELAIFLSQTTFCPIFEAVKAQLPSGMQLRLTECYEINPNVSDEGISSLSDEEARIYREIKSSNKVKNVLKTFEI